MLEGTQVILGVTGGIAAYKACSLVRMLMSKGAAVQVVMTRHAMEFVGPCTFESLSQRGVATDLFGPRPAGPMPHIELAKWADVLAIAPATANIIGKIAAGIADDLLSTLVMATAIREAQTVFDRYQNYDRGSGRALERIFSIRSACQFFDQLAAADRDVAYYGNEVSLIDADCVLLRWRTDEGDYQVVFGDLHTERVAAQRLSQLEARFPRSR